MKTFQTTFSSEQFKKLYPIFDTGELGFGSNVKKLEKSFNSFSNKLYNIATNSASASAFMIFAYLKEKYGECDIYTPSLAFTSPAWSAKHHGHNLIWIDINDNLLFDCEDYHNKRKSNTNTPVVMPILYGGVSNIDNWKLIGDEIVVIDSAHCVTPTIKSDFIFFSFHPYKPICSSDGGMISTDNKEADKWFRDYRNFGRQNKNNTYDIVQEGFKFYMNNLNASIALLSIDKYQYNLEIRKNNYIKLDNVLPHDKNSSFYFATQLDKNANSFNKERKLARHYPLLHKTKYFNSNSCLPKTELLYSQIINLPLWKLL